MATKATKANRNLKRRAIIAILRFVKFSKKKGSGPKYPRDLRKKPLFKTVGRS